jgi:hypothetical protein
MKYEKKKQHVTSKRRKTQKFISVKYENFLETKYIQWPQDSLMSCHKARNNQPHFLQNNSQSW